MMGRIVSPMETIAQLKLSAPPYDVCIALTDSVLTENNAVFKLSGVQGLAQLTHTDEEPQVRLGIGPLAQLCFGAHNPDSLHTAGFLETSDQAALNALRMVFPARVNYINEYF